MAFRNHTEAFKKLRDRFKVKSLSLPGGRKQNGVTEGLLGESMDPYAEADASPKHHTQPPPIWVETLNSINSDIRTIETRLKELDKLHGQQSAQFKWDDNDGGKGQQEEMTSRDRINICTQEIHRLFKSSQKGLKRIATIGNSGTGTRLPYQERQVRLNVMRSRASKVQDLTKTFRKMQKKFLTDEANKEENKTAMKYFTDDVNMEGIFDNVDKGLSTQQMQALEERTQDASKREQEIVNIAKSVNEIATIFKELNVLVIEQGTILDRIDYNVEQTLEQLKAAKEEVIESEKYQKKSSSITCILILLVAIALCALILIFKAM